MAGNKRRHDSHTSHQTGALVSIMSKGWAQKLRVFYRRPNKKLFLIAGVLVLLTGVALAGWFAFGKNPDGTDKVIFTINNKEYKQPYVVNLISYATNIYPDKDPNDYAQTVFDILKNKTAAEKIGIQISDDDLLAAQKSLFPSQQGLAKEDTWVRLLSYRDALSNKLNINQARSGNAAGSIFIFGFTTHMKLQGAEKAPEYSEQDQQNIETDRQYAQTQAEAYRQRLSTGELTADQALSKIRQDKRLVVSGYESATFDGFDGQNAKGAPGTFQYPNILQAITTTKVNQVSDVQFNQDEEASDDGWPARRFYFFVYIRQQESSYKDWQQLFQQTVTEIKSEYKGL